MPLGSLLPLQQLPPVELAAPLVFVTGGGLSSIRSPEPFREDDLLCLEPLLYAGGGIVVPICVPCDGERTSSVLISRIGTECGCGNCRPISNGEGVA